MLDGPPALTGAEVARLLDLEPLPVEGGLWRQTWSDEHGTAIYFLMQPGDFSAMHRLDIPELWHHYAGAPVRMLLLEPGGSVSRPLLGDGLADGQRPFVPVGAGVWMGAATLGAWSLVGTTMAPPFHREGFELGVLEELVERYPSAAAEIADLVRQEPA